MIRLGVCDGFVRGELEWELLDVLGKLVSLRWHSCLQSCGIRWEGFATLVLC
jgi:hypothetical protein